MRAEVPEPWRAFPAELDRAVPSEVQLHCLGGFVMIASYGMPRPTADVDVLAVTPRDALKLLLELGGQVLTVQSATVAPRIGAGGGAR